MVPAGPILYCVVVCFYDADPSGYQAFWFFEVTKPYERSMVSSNDEFLS